MNSNNMSYEPSFYGSQQPTTLQYRTGTVTIYLNGVPSSMWPNYPITPEIILSHYNAACQVDRVFIEFMDDGYPIPPPEGLVQPSLYQQLHGAYQQQRVPFQGRIAERPLARGVQQAQSRPQPQEPATRRERVMIDLTDEPDSAPSKEPSASIKSVPERILTERVTYLWHRIREALDKRFVAEHVVAEWKRWLHSFEDYPVVKHKKEWATLYWSSNEAAFKHLRFVSKYFFDYGSTRLRFLSWFAPERHSDEFRKEMLRLAEGRDDDDRFGFVQTAGNEELEKEVRELEWAKAKVINLEVTNRLERMRHEEKLEKRREYMAQKKAGTWQPKKMREAREKKEIMSERKRKREEKKEAAKTRVKENKKPRGSQEDTTQIVGSALAAYPSPSKTPAPYREFSEAEGDMQGGYNSPSNSEESSETPSFIDISRSYDDMAGFFDGPLPSTDEQLTSNSLASREEAEATSEADGILEDDDDPDFASMLDLANEALNEDHDDDDESIVSEEE